MKILSRNLLFRSGKLKMFNKVEYLNKISNRRPLVNQLKYSFSKQNISSRQVDIKINEERWKSLQNNYKALKTSFGLIIPSTISKDYSKPDRIQYNLESLRQCSNQHPQYLWEQLKKQDSQFYGVIDKELNNLWVAQKKQALEMISFVIHWKVYQTNYEISEMLLRTIQKIDFNTFQIFQLLKTILSEGQKQKINKFKLQNPEKLNQTQSLNESLNPLFKRILIVCENKIVQRLEIIDASQYQPLFKIVNLFRLHDVYPQTKKQDDNEVSFFQIIQKNLIKNINEIPPPSLVIMAVHYANNSKQDQDQKINILQKLEERIIFNMKFFNDDQIIALLYSYMKTSMLSKECTQQFVKRIKLIYPDMSWQNKKKILSLSSNFPQHQKMLIISEAHNQLLKGKPVTTKLQDGTIKREYDSKVFIDLDCQLVPEIYLASYENNLLTEQLARKMQEIILNNIFNFEKQQVVRSIWLFTVSPDINNNLQKIHKKLQVIIEGGFQGGQYTIKDISILVWSLCNSGKNNQQIYKLEASFWNNIEFYLQQKLQKMSPKQEVSRINNVSSILWAYTFNKALKFKTVSLLTDILLQQLDVSIKDQPNLQSFELINIITFYYSLPVGSFPKILINKMKQLCARNFQVMYKQMGSLQLMKCLKYLTADQSEGESNLIVVKLKMWQNIVQIFTLQVQQIEYQHIMGIVGLVINSPLGRSKDKNVITLVDQLLKRKKSLEQIKPAQS